METLLDPAFTFYRPNRATPERGYDAHEEWWVEHYGGFPDALFTIEEMIIAEDNVIAVRWTLNATNDGVFLDIPAKVETRSSYWVWTLYVSKMVVLPNYAVISTCIR